MRKIGFIYFLIALVFVQTQSCAAQDDTREIFSTNSEVQLLFFFKKESSRTARDNFYVGELNKRVSGGHWPREGVQATFGVDLNGYEGYGITFRPNAPESQKREVIDILSKSPLIHRIYQNVTPNKINDLDEDVKDGRVKEIFNADSKVELLFFYKKDSTEEQRRFFDENELMKNSDRGQYMRDGVQAIFGIDRNGYEGAGIRFRPEATKEQREEVKRILATSPLVHKIYENVEPNKIEDLD